MIDVVVVMIIEYDLTESCSGLASKRLVKGIQMIKYVANDGGNDTLVCDCACMRFGFHIYTSHPCIASLSPLFSSLACLVQI